jgi:hypothetical protein
MNPKLVLGLGILALVMLTLALMIGRGLSTPEEQLDEPLVPGLRDQVNDIEAIDIVGADGETVVTLRRERERWRVQEKSGFEADFRLIHALLRDLAEARRADERTSNPDWYPRLGVADPGVTGSDGMLVRFPGTGLPGVIVGIPDPAGIGRFARLLGEERTWLIDRSPDVPGSRVEWLESAIMDIPARELAEVTIRHPDAETVRLRPAGDDSDRWVLLDVPEGREAVSSWQIRPVVSSLAALSLRDVRPSETVPEDAVRALFRTIDGLIFVASLFEDDEAHWVSFSVSADTTAVAEEETDDEVSELAIDAAAVHGRLSPWQFAIPASRYNDMTRRLEDLLTEGDD